MSTTTRPFREGVTFGSSGTEGESEVGKPLAFQKLQKSALAQIGRGEVSHGEPFCTATKLAATLVNARRSRRSLRAFCVCAACGKDFGPNRGCRGLSLPSSSLIKDPKETHGLRHDPLERSPAETQPREGAVSRPAVS